MENICWQSLCYAATRLVDLYIVKDETFSSALKSIEVGPFGHNRAEIPAVQAGDQIVDNPLILRPCNDGDPDPQVYPNKQSPSPYTK
jgi:hypothetical protein